MGELTGNKRGSETREERKENMVSLLGNTVMGDFPEFEIDPGLCVSQEWVLDKVERRTTV